MNNPAIVWADEPTGNLDSEGAQQVLGVMMRLHREHNQTSVVVTHDYSVGALANRMIRMKDGMIVTEEALVHEAAASKDPTTAVDSDAAASTSFFATKMQPTERSPVMPNALDSYRIDFVINGSATACTAPDVTTSAAAGNVTELKTEQSREGRDHIQQIFCGARRQRSGAARGGDGAERRKAAHHTFHPRHTL